MTTELEKSCPGVARTALWKLLESKAEQGELTAETLSAVSALCAEGAALSKDIVRFFPNYTLHDETHIANVCDWMLRLLDEDLKRRLTSRQAVLLLLAACWHDAGMSVSADEEGSLARNPRSQAWTAFFREHKREELAYERDGAISPETLRSFVRFHHPARVRNKLTNWSSELQRLSLRREDLLALCESHGKALEDCPALRKDPDLPLCAVLLRLADILDFDASRAPEPLFRHRGLDAPTDLEQRISRTEWAKNRAGVLSLEEDGILRFTARFTDLQLEMEVRAYLDWIKEELEGCAAYLRYTRDWSGLKLPYKLDYRADRVGYSFGDFRLSMDQDKVLELLTGKNLYPDAGVFVRELLQNAIDAVLTRRATDPGFRTEDGDIRIRTWQDGEGFDWFQIVDNGIGMDEDVILNYFLKVGRSYYSSEDFRADLRRYGGGKCYAPISRFGIGILSCFMADPERSRIEVSTRKRSPDVMRPNPALRLSVTGLHGYYYLAKEDAQAEAAQGFRPMPCPPGETAPGYRTEPGTTLCVRTNLFRLGSQASFRALVDKYLFFPEVRVCYEGPEGQKSYPTQGKLMELIHGLNPAGPGRPLETYWCPIPDEDFVKLQAHDPSVSWTERPAFGLQFVPLDWGTDPGSGVSGAAIRVLVRGRGQGQPFEIHGQTYPMEIIVKKYRYSSCATDMAFYLSDRNGLDKQADRLRQQFAKTEGESRLKDAAIAWPYSFDAYGAFYFGLCFSALRVALPKDVWEAFSLLTEAIGVADDDRFAAGPVTAFQGVRVDDKNLLYLNSMDYLTARLLLNGPQAPEVDLGRAGISALPLELCAELLLLHKQINREYFAVRLKEIAVKSKYHLLPRRELRALLEQHPVWREALLSGEYDLSRIQEALVRGEKVVFAAVERHDLLDALRAAALAEFASISNNYSSWSSTWLTAMKARPELEDFPPLMFAEPLPSTDRRLLNMSSFKHMSSFKPNFLNIEHCFSQWLIRNGAALREQVPELYGELLDNLTSLDGKVELIEAVNRTLRLLSGYPGNAFSVTEDLYLTDEDITEY